MQNYIFFQDFGEGGFNAQSQQETGLILNFNRLQLMIKINFTLVRRQISCVAISISFPFVQPLKSHMIHLHLTVAYANGAE